ncbi:MAG: hypothetical protein AAFY88_27220 [Acidobacteriota bacterium]
MIYNVPFFVAIPCLLGLIALIFFSEDVASLIILVSIPASILCAAAWEKRSKRRTTRGREN